MEIIEFLDDLGNTMVKRIPGKGSGEFKYGAQLTVRESQAAIFFRDGKALDIFYAGRHVLKTQNIPLITKAITSLGYGANSPFRSEVYFLNLKLFKDLKWGTSEPIIFRDSELEMVRLRSFGVFSILIEDPQLFLNKIVGTQNIFYDSELEAFLKAIIIQNMHTILGENLETIFDLPTKFANLSVLLKNKVKLEFESFGIKIHDFLISSISVPPEVQNMIDKRSGMSAVGNLKDFMKYQTGNSIEKAAENPSGGASEGIGMGAGLGMGLLMPQMFSSAFNESQSSGVNSDEDFLSKIKKLKELLDSGAIDNEEFTKIKKRILNNL